MIDGRGRRPSVLALCAVMALTVVGCGSSATTIGRGDGSRPRDGGTLSIAWQGDITSLDPTVPYDVESWMAERLIFEPLLTYDRSTNLVPLLAAALPDVSSDGKTYTVHLRGDVSFVDRAGDAVRAMTATDIVASFNRLFDPNLRPASANAGLFGDIAGAQDVIGGKSSSARGVVAVDSHTVQFTLTQPDVSFENLLALPLASIVPVERAGRDTARFSADPVGTGPYLLQKYSSGQEAIFVRNPHYWDRSRKGPDTIRFRVGVDPVSALQQIQVGSLDLMGNELPAASFTSVVHDARLASQVYHRPLIETEFVFLDTQPASSSPLSNPAVRRALEFAIDKSHILTLTHGAGVVANCVFPPDLPAYDSSCAPYSYDPSTARRLLAEAGYANGFTTDFYTDTGDPDPAIAEAIKQDLSAVGVEIHIVTQPEDALLTSIDRHQAPMGWSGWLQDYPDPSDFVDPILSCSTAALGQSNNPSWYCNSEVDHLALAARRELDPQKRMALYQQIQRQIMADAPLIPVRHAEHYTLVGARLRGFEIHPVWLYDLASMWVTQ